jgi:hypothetical protein
MILLWGLSGDDPLEEVRRSLERLGASFLLLDQRDVLGTELELEALQRLFSSVRVFSIPFAKQRSRTGSRG